MQNVKKKKINNDLALESQMISMWKLGVGRQ